MLAAVRRSLVAPSNRAFSTSRVSAADVAKLILIGRLGRDPEVRMTRNDKEYVAYTVATTNYPPPPPNPDGSRPPSETSWHNIYSFNPNANQFLRTLTRGTQVYVEANYEMREVEPTEEDGKRTKQVFLRHEVARVLSRPPSAKHDESEDESH